MYVFDNHKVVLFHSDTKAKQRTVEICSKDELSIHESMVVGLHAKLNVARDESKKIRVSICPFAKIRCDRSRKFARIEGGSRA